MLEKLDNSFQFSLIKKDFYFMADAAASLQKPFKNFYTYKQVYTKLMFQCNLIFARHQPVIPVFKIACLLEYSKMMKNWIHK